MAGLTVGKVPPSEDACQALLMKRPTGTEAARPLRSASLVVSADMVGTGEREEGGRERTLSSDPTSTERLRKYMNRLPPPALKSAS